MKLITCQGEIERLNEVIKVKLIEGNQLKQDNRGSQFVNPQQLNACAGFQMLQRMGWTAGAVSLIAIVLVGLTGHSGATAAWGSLRPAGWPAPGARAV